MVFKTECSKFLDTVTNLRKATIEREVQKMIEIKHEPYKREMERVRDEVIKEAVESCEREILAIQAKRDAKIQNYRTETNKAIEAHKENLINVTTESVKANYDKFILSVSKLVDDTNIKD